MISLQKARPVNANQVIEKPIGFSIFVIPTWSCTLRCPYCFVKKNLKKEFYNENIDINKLTLFVENYKKSYPNSKPGSIIFLGGEPLLNPDLIINFSPIAKKLGFKIFCTTNLAYQWTDKVSIAISLIDKLNASIDGPPEKHTINRKKFKSIDNPIDDENTFWMSYENLCKATKLTNVMVQASLDEWTEDTFDRFFNLMLSAGVNEENIKIGFIAWNKSKERHKNQSPVEKPCCAFRYMERFVVTQNGICANYFEPSQSKIGELTDNIEEIATNFENYILDNMPSLHDEECNKCDLFKHCYGGCYGHHLGAKPSERCNKEILRKNVNDGFIKKDTSHF